MKQPKEDREVLMKEETKLASHSTMKVPPRFRFLRSPGISDSVRQFILKRIDTWYSLEPTNDEFHKLTNWVSSLEKIPFDSSAPSIQSLLTESKQSISEFLINAKSKMDTAVYGHEEAKEQILELLAKEYSNQDGNHGFCIGI